MKQSKYRELVRSYYMNKFECNDPAHNLDHIDSVCELALEISTKLELDVNIHEVILASYIHDSCMENRKNHHELAFDYVMKAQDDLLKFLNNDAIKRIAYAVLEHRASYKGTYYSDLSRVISAADRGRLNKDEMITRSLKFTKNKYPWTKEYICKEVLKHMRDKYSSIGYARYNEVYTEYFNDAIIKVQKEMDDLTLDYVKSKYNETFN